LAHAIADAILGALCEGDLGVHFPDQDPHWIYSHG
jgi:2C-methyl-D-erythritol 2,4-cyclodiphosphate synthase